MRGAWALRVSLGGPQPRGPLSAARSNGARRGAAGRPSPLGAASPAAAPAASGGRCPLRQWPWGAALTSGSLSVVGDLIAQGLERRARGSSDPLDTARTGRMGGFGFVYYGPLQHFWYAFLAARFPVDKSLPLARYLPPFVAKVALNQLVLAPVVITSVFAWNLALQARSAELPAKLRADLQPTLLKGWSFWVPAASLNFWLVPLHLQVTYMSVCGIVWSSILSNASR